MHLVNLGYFVGTMSFFSGIIALFLSKGTFGDVAIIGGIALALLAGIFKSVRAIEKSCKDQI
ncbi:MAG: hypothetical protein COB93_00200 [Sneathiella sp.]|nr:MAG: hypothetical protein COB93_00200 [Sneathiella sp.]